MCLAVPGKILSIRDGAHAEVDMLGARREVSVRLTPKAKVGEYVLVHAGFAIQVVDAQEAAETLELVRDLADLAEGELPAENLTTPGLSSTLPADERV